MREAAAAGVMPLGVCSVCRFMCVCARFRVGGFTSGSLQLSLPHFPGMAAMQAFRAFMDGSIDLTEYKAQLCSAESPAFATIPLVSFSDATRIDEALDQFIRAFPKLQKLAIASPSAKVLPCLCRALSVHKSVTDLALYSFEHSLGRTFGGDLGAMRGFAAWLCSDDCP